MLLGVSTFVNDERGGIIIIAGFGLPLLALGIGATIEYGSLAYRHSVLQKAADGAALAATQQLRLANSTDYVVDTVATSTFDALAPLKADNPRTVSGTVENSKRNSVQVTATESVRSVLGKLMTLPSSELSVTASAKIASSGKLCLLTLDAKNDKGLSLDDGSLVTANGCVIQSNSKSPKGLHAGKAAQATAAAICSAGGVDNAGASLSPSATTDCPSIPDPLANRARPGTGVCSGLEKALTINVATTLFPGTYCNGLTIAGNAQVTLAAGTYVIDNGPLIVTNKASMSGSGVGFFFTGDKGGLRFDPDTTISLSAPKDGDMAGLLFFEDRTVSATIPLPIPLGGTAPPPPPTGSPPMRQYRVTSDNAPNLLGTIYLPAGRLIIDAKKPVADRSAYTVIVVKQLDLNSGPNLFLNTSYASSDVPVPDGVGPRTGSVSLTR